VFTFKIFYLETSLHRYVFLIYEQPGKLTFDEERLDTSGEGRGTFSIRNFAKKYNLGQPTVGNFFQAEWESDELTTGSTTDHHHQTTGSRSPLFLMGSRWLVVCGMILASGSR